jgi:hypothetical protein
MIPGFATVLAASRMIAAIYSSVPATGLARSSRTSKRTFGFAGRLMLFSTASQPGGRGFFPWMGRE